MLDFLALPCFCLSHAMVESTIRIVDDSLLQRYIVKRDVGDGYGGYSVYILLDINLP